MNFPSECFSSVKRYLSAASESHNWKFISFCTATKKKKDERKKKFLQQFYSIEGKWTYTKSFTFLSCICTLLLVSHLQPSRSFCERWIYEIFIYECVSIFIAFFAVYENQSRLLKVSCWIYWGNEREINKKWTKYFSQWIMTEKFMTRIWQVKVLENFYVIESAFGDWIRIRMVNFSVWSFNVFGAADGD